MFQGLNEQDSLFSQSGDDEKERVRDDGFDVFKLAASFHGFISIASCSAALVVSATMLPALMPAVSVGISLGVLAGSLTAAFGFKMIAVNPYPFLFGLGIALALGFGGILAGWEAFTLFMNSSSYYGVPAWDIAIAGCIGFGFTVLFSVINSFKRKSED